MIKLIFDDVNKLAKFKFCKLYISEFTVFVNARIDNLKDFSKKDTDLLNYILFTKESKDFYLSKNKNTHNDVIGLQEGFGLFVE